MFTNTTGISATEILRPRVLSWFSRAGWLLELAEVIPEAWSIWGSIAPAELAIDT